MLEEFKDKSFTIHRDNGVFLSFPNGNSISTIWGWGSYTENHDWHPDPTKQGTYDISEIFKRIPEGSNTVEIMFNCGVLLKKKILKKFNNKDEQPIGHLNIVQWLEIINLLAKEKHVKKKNN